jgi:uncharacterized protein
MNITKTKLEVLWRQVVEAGSEHLVLSMDDGIHADSLSVGEIENTTYRIHYQLHCDAGWNVQRLRIKDLLLNHVVTLVRGKDNRWSDDGNHLLEALDGCVDVDIMITPFTNTLPIQRLKLKTGQSREIAVVYIGLPGLIVSRFEQRYTCLASNSEGSIYKYESLKSGFTAELKLDVDGLVTDYPDIFRMEAKRRLASD